MAAIKYKVELTEAERSRLNEVSQRGKASVRTVKRALSLLKADPTSAYKKAAICVRKCPAMAAIKYKVELTEAERSRLNEVSQRGKASVRTVKRALSLLKADQGLRDREIADVLLVNPATVARARKRYVEEGLEAAINDRPRPGQERKLDGRQEALSRVNYICRLASISFAGSPPWPGPVAGQRWSGSWGRQTPG